MSMLLIKAASVFYPSQSIGNSTTDEALVLMRQLYAHCAVQVAVLSAHQDVTGNPTRPGGTLLLRRRDAADREQRQILGTNIHRAGATAGLYADTAVDRCARMCRLICGRRLS